MGTTGLTMVRGKMFGRNLKARMDVKFELDPSQSIPKIE